MARTDAIVLGAGIVGTAIALHLAKRGLAVALVDRRGPGEETSYGNAGIIEGNTVFPAAVSVGLRALAAHRAQTRAGSQLSPAFLPQVAPWLLAYRAARRPARLIETARVMRPLFARAVAEHEALMAEAGAHAICARPAGSRSTAATQLRARQARELRARADFGIPSRALDPRRARALEPSLAPVLRHAVFWEGAASVSDPLALTQAYAARFAALGGVVLAGDARSLHRAGGALARRDR